MPPCKTQLVILADDLSGAADCAVSYAAKGLSTTVELTAQSRADSHIAVFDTDSRHLPPVEAANLCLETWRLNGSSDLKLYKKIDSTLRGNWAEEVAALIPEAGMAIVAPAMPAMKRVTRQARQYIDQTPVEESEVWRNEQLAGRADIVVMLAHQGVKSAHLPLATLRKSSIETLTRWFAEQRENTLRAVVCDAETDEDLKRIASATQSIEGAFWVGSAGLSQALSHYAGSDSSSAVPVRTEVNGPVLVVVGSMSPISHRQIDYLTQQAGEALGVFRVDIHALLNASTAPDTLLNAQAALERGEDVLVTLDQQTPDASINGYALSRRLAYYLGPQLGGLGGLIATGGETAKALLSAGGIERLSLTDELEPGVVLSLDDHGLPVVTKAGGFGKDSSLYQAWRYLAHQRLDDSLVGESCQAHRRT
ncbi:uncharacterized protein YgbK (DUF1537 family) [Vreelandella songnenensis]|uniref:Uncharacterized protein YgbK (DUF1537 family) n=1 Tax=Vreelandella songnenensis TaxID=1176243 RepID=A0A2T0V7P0_9GAMM|nr:four-carbon acid sugar kinase family protein [Halomonas songnenensis]PRY66205.1 uncharacterized protein YgbK (DUF1537 family) [Halomonas songnenensis]